MPATAAERATALCKKSLKLKDREPTSNEMRSAVKHHNFEGWGNVAVCGKVITYKKRPAERRSVTP